MHRDAVFDAHRRFACGRRARHMDVSATCGEAGGQSFGEFRSTIDFGRVGLRRDEDATGRCVTVSGQNSALLGVGHLVCATGYSTLVFSIFDIGMITRQYNDSQTRDQSCGCDHDDEPDGGRCSLAEDD